MDPGKRRFCKDLGRKLFSARSIDGRTQAEVARSAGIAPNNYARIERGEVVPSGYTLWRIAAALGVTVDELVSK